LQTPWTRFLDEVAEVGYQWLELGPFGYLPSDKARLTDELGRRGLRVAGGTVHGFSGCTGPVTGRTSSGSPARCPSSPPRSAGGT
jgi:Sugar phosphate isomerases/epimerases